MHRILEATKAEGAFHNYVLWALYSAMRRSEILDMRWKDIQQHANGKTQVTIPKSKSGKPRTLNCSEAMIEILKNQKPLEKSGEFVFSLTKKSLAQKMKKIRDTTGIQDIQLHDLRTMYITYSLLAGVNVKTLTGITGHSDLQMIQKHYSVVVDSDLADASRKASEFINGILGQ
jgi:integrase